MNDSKSYAERLVDMGALSCGCGVAIGLIIMGACAGAAAPEVPKGIGIGIGIIGAIVVAALAFLLSKKNAALLAARAELERKQQDEAGKP
jgi:hypothetical protein